MVFFSEFGGAPAETLAELDLAALRLDFGIHIAFCDEFQFHIAGGVSPGQKHTGLRQECEPAQRQQHIQTVSEDIVQGDRLYGLAKKRVQGLVVFGNPVDVFGHDASLRMLANLDFPWRRALPYVACTPRRLVPHLARYGKFVSWRFSADAVL
ncbi:MAG: hypothetical protein JJ900_18735, partial [Rhodospirillales bacterium]|nr:hypothetical protein [Rhodospirillales bacterium]MBO6788884.1 hypothetical protein [Rhodospirillales bacterium]